MLERTILARVQATARSLGWYPIKIHGNAYQLAGIPDCLVLKEGRAAWMEVKRPGQKPSPLQVVRMGELKKAGCPVAVVTSAQEAKEFLTNVAIS